MLEHTPRAFVERLDFVTTVGYGDGPGARERYGLTGRGVTAVITDLCVLEPDAATCELTLTALHPGVSAEDVRRATGWPLRVAEQVEVGAPPSAEELGALRALKTFGGRNGG
jgi:glutaconate CoA-transferase subunit B